VHGHTHLGDVENTGVTAGRSAHLRIARPTLCLCRHVVLAGFTTPTSRMGSWQRLQSL